MFQGLIISDECILQHHEMLEDTVAIQDEQTDRWTCLLGVCLYVLVTLEVVNLARN